MALVDRNGPMGKAEFLEAGELAYALRQWETNISQASWALDSALRGLRLAKRNSVTFGNDVAIVAAEGAVHAAAKRAQEVWELLT